MNHSDRPYSLIHAGTSVRSVDGGIALALRGHEAAARSAGLPCTLVETHVAAGMREKVGPWMRSFGAIRSAVLAAREQGRVPVVWAHAGEWPSLVRKASVLRWARAHGAHTVLHLHAVEFDTYLDRELGRRALPRLVENADRVVVLSPWWQRRLAREQVPTHVIPNPLPPDLERVASAGARRETGDGPLRVLVMTRLVPGKGVELALRAAAGMGEDVQLTVAGDGPRASALARLAQKLGVAVRFSGWVRDATKDELFAEHHVLCHASGRDAAPMVVVEALARALPVVVLDSRSVPDLVPHERAGIVVPRPDPALLADALQRLRDPGVRLELGRGGRSWALEHLSAAASARRLTGLLSTLGDPGT
jgi:glycosyltransferase involved in cell wall biosynthesis